ncbi:MAG TPA: teichoic acid D-Ala incorporation-associated protein DltX [Symbiobacteriaceae bacterium]
MLRHWISSVTTVYRLPIVETTLRVFTYVTVLIVLFYLYTGGDNHAQFIYTNF